MTKYKHPEYSVQYPIAVMDQNQAGIVVGLGALTGFREAAQVQTTIQRNIAVDGRIFTQDIHEGGKYRFGDGTVTAPSIAFKGSPKTGFRRPAANQVSIVANGAQEVNVSASSVTFSHTIGVKDGEVNPVVIDRNGSTARLQHLQDADGTIALTSDIVSPSSPLLDGSIHTDTVAQSPTKGSIVVANSTPKWDEQTIGADGNVLTADSTQTNGLRWAAPSGGSSHTVLDGVTHTDTVAQTVSKGSLIAGNATPKWDEMVVGSNDLPLVADSTQTLGLIYKALPIAGGGTGQTTATAAFNALDPLTTKGDLVTHDGTDSVRKAVGTDGHVFTADSAQATGNKWAAIPTQTSTLLDGSVHTDTVAQGATKGSIVVANSTPKWDELVVGTDTHVLTADSAQTLGVKWAAPATQTSTLLDGSVHTDTAASTVARGDIIVANSTPKWSKLAVGSSTNPKKIVTSDGTDATWVRNQGAAVHVPTTGDTAINSVTDVTIVTKDVTDVAAGDQVVIEGEFTILNNSGATRVYVITVDFDAAFDIEFSTAALATSATLIHPFSFRAVCDIRSTSLCYCVNKIYGQLAAGIASGGDTTMLATNLHACGWGTNAGDRTGTLTCALFIRSANATATQTCRLHHFSIRKFTPF